MYQPLVNIFMNDPVLIIDEIDSSLHPSLVGYLVDLLNGPSLNINGAQLIFNTHDVSLLDQEIFRRGQIYFVEKDNSHGISDLYSLFEFSPRKSEDIRKGYLTGIYGAIPIVVPWGLEKNCNFCISSISGKETHGFSRWEELPYPFFF